MKKTLMIIDDDEDFIYIFKRVCEKIEGITFLSASDGRDALKQLESHLEGKSPKPDLLFIDINMPGMNGLVFLKEFANLKSLHPSIQNIKPIIMLTSSEQEEDKKQALKLGASRYFTKPDGMADLKQIVKDSIE